MRPIPELERIASSLIARAQDVETLMNLTPVFVVPAHILVGFTHIYGYTVIHAAVPTAYVAITP